MAFYHKEKNKPTPYLHYYRAFDDYAIDIIKNKRLYLKSALDFNDPFDCNAFYLREGSAQYYKRKMNSDLKKTYLSDSHKKQTRRILQEKLYELDTFWYGVKEGMQSEINKFGIFSFTERPDNFLMWSHYANKHSGICIAFEMKNMPEDLRRIVKIRYCKNRPLINFGDQSVYHKIFNIKSNLWKYEREWRVVVSKLAREYVQFSDNCIKAVICGIKMEKNQIQELLKHLSGFKNDVIVFKTIKSPIGFNVKFEKLHYK